VEEKVEAPEADGGGDSSQAASDVQITGARIFTDAPAPTGTLTMSELAVLPHALRMLHTIGSGRCSIAAPMLSLGRLPRDHDDAKRKDRPRIHRRIDEERVDLGKSMSALWNEDRWIREVPVDMRMSRVNDAVNRHTSQTSYDILRRMLTDPQQRTAWMEPSVFYVAAEMYEVGIFVITWYAHSGRGAANYRHIRPASTKHIIVWFADGHFQAVQYDGKSTFGSSHRVVQHLRLLCVSHAPEVVKEDDIDVQILVARLGVSTHPAADAPEAVDVRPAAAPSAQPLRRTSRVIPVKATPPADPAASPSRALPAAKSLTGTGSSKGRQQVTTASSSRRATGVAAQADSQPQTIRSAASYVPIAGAPLSPADVAAHGQLYDFISFPNVPQWQSMCAIPFNAYRLASQGNDRAGQRQALEDILMLPQRVLTRTGRGPGDHRRLNRVMRARCNTQGELLRARYDCQPARDHNVQLSRATETGPLVHRAAASSAGAGVASEAPTVPSADTVRVSEDDAAAAADDAEAADDCDDNAASAFTSAPRLDASHPDVKAAKRAQHHVRQGHLQKAARVLHSVDAMADLRLPEVQQAITELHPELPAASLIPALPLDAPQQILEDDDVMVSLLRQSDNGSASGPSGWGGNMLSSLAQSDLCRMGIIALLKDIVNGNLPERARQLLVSSRLVALTKPNGNYRPIAVGELFYRLAGVIVVRKVTTVAAALLSPHQLGVGVRSGAERIVHSLQHSLTDKQTRRALLQVDISNAFNSCNRARVLRQLYEQPTLSGMWRIADFGYSAPSQLLLQRCEGQHLLSSNGVKQGDPLSAILFCLYLRDVLIQVAAQAEVDVQGFFDDINISGEPVEVMKAFDALQRLLPGVGLEFNTAKSHFAYFHEAEAPLMRSTLTTLAEHNVQVHGDWVEVVGAVIGRDEAAIRAGVAATLGQDTGAAAFFARLQLDDLKVQSAMLILRQCGVPKMNYALRCIPPPCIAPEATAFDELVIGTATTKLLLHTDEAKRRPTVERLRAPLRHGGFGLASALVTSPEAFLGSMAAVSAAPAFVQYSQPDTSLPRASLLHDWIEGSMDAVTDATPDCKELLPAAAAAFFEHFTPRSPKSSSLQHQLHEQATESSYKASLQLARDMKTVDGGLALARLNAVSAPRAWTWKLAAPTSKELEMTDTEYRISARLNLGLQPIDGTAALPDVCPLCKDANKTIRDDPWHFLSCQSLHKGEVTVRHDTVNGALYRCALTMGLPARLEPTGLDPKSDKRPDMLLNLPGRRIITDVAIVHPVAPGNVRAKISHTHLGAARRKENEKRKHYTDLVALHGYQLYPFIMETCGGMGPGAVRLVKIMAEAGEAHMRVWAKEDAVQELLHTVAVAVQRGGALSYLHGYQQALDKLRGAAGAVVAKRAVEGEKGEGRLREEDEEDAASAA
jgi:hypothetical protein